MSPHPTLRTMSTSSVASMVYEHRAPISDGSIPASVQASTMTRQASSVSDGPKCLANGVWAMPAMAVESRNAEAGLMRVLLLTAAQVPAVLAAAHAIADLTACQKLATIGVMSQLLIGGKWVEASGG